MCAVTSWYNVATTENLHDEHKMRKDYIPFNRNVQKLDYSRVVNLAVGDLKQ